MDETALFAALERAIGVRGGPGKVLIVEDDPDLDAILTAIFERHGIQTSHAADGREAIELSQRRHRRRCALPLVVYTARDLDEADRRRLRLGASTELRTNGRITPQDFEQRVMRLLERLTGEPTAKRRSRPAHHRSLTTSASARALARPLGSGLRARGSGARSACSRLMSGWSGGLLRRAQ